MNSLFEPEDNSLTIEIDLCKAHGISIGGNDAFSSYISMDVDETLPVIRLEFDSYIAYSVRNESFTAKDMYEVYKGQSFSLYSRSRYLDYIEISTIAEDVIARPFKHYGINALNHIIDIVSADFPNVSVLQRNSQQEQTEKKVKTFLE